MLLSFVHIFLVVGRKKESENVVAIFMGGRGRFKGDLMLLFTWAVTGAVWIVASSMWAVTASIWDFAASMWAVAGAMWDVAASVWAV